MWREKITVSGGGVDTYEASSATRADVPTPGTAPPEWAWHDCHAAGCEQCSEGGRCRVAGQHKSRSVPRPAPSPLTPKRRYEESDKGKETRSRYSQSERGREVKQAVDARYDGTAKGMIRRVRHEAKRRGTR